MYITFQRNQLNGAWLWWEFLKNPASLSWSFIIIPFVIDSKLARIFQDKCLIDYPENKQSLGILRLAHCPPLITVNRAVDQKNCHFLWHWTHRVFGVIGVGHRGSDVAQTAGRSIMAIALSVGTWSQVFLGSLVQSWTVSWSSCQDFFLGNVQSVPVNANSLLSGSIKSLKCMFFCMFTGGYVSQVGLPLGNDERLQAT